MNQRPTPDPNTFYIIEDIYGPDGNLFKLRPNLDEAIDCAVQCMKSTATQDMADGLLMIDDLEEFWDDWNSMSDDKDIQGLCNTFTDLYEEEEFKPGVNIIEVVLGSDVVGNLVWDSARGSDARIPMPD